MTHLKTLLIGPANRALMGMGYCRATYDTAWQTWQRKFGQFHSIVSTQVSKIQRYPFMKPYDSECFINLMETISKFVHVLQQFDYSNDFFLSSILKVVVNKLPAGIKRRWFAFVEAPTGRLKLPNSLEILDSLQDEALVQERRTLHSPKVNVDENRAKGKFLWNDTTKRSSNFSASQNNRSKASKSYLRDKDHPFWKCEKFKTLTLEQRFEKLKELDKCFSCLKGRHNVRDCKTARKCNIVGCKREHNRLLHVPKDAKTTFFSIVMKQIRQMTIQSQCKVCFRLHP